MTAFPSSPAARAGLLAAAILAATVAAAQAPHPIPRASRPLHVRMEAADAVAVATVRTVEMGRIHLADVTPLVGEVAGAFEVKRSPSGPLPLSEGDRALLLLRGARSPYLSVDTPAETIRLADAEAEVRWTEAVRTLHREREHPDAWVGLYVRWLDTGPGSLRDLAVTSLSDPRAPYQPLPESFFLERAEAAWDPDRLAEARRAAAWLAAFHPTGTARLAALGAPCPEEADLDVLEISTRAVLLQAIPGAEALVLCALGQPDANLRTTVLQTLVRGRVPLEGPLRARVEALADDEGEPVVSQAARKLLGRRGP